MAQRAAPTRRIDVKVYLANERTFLTWMRQAVLVGGIGAAVSGLAAYQGIPMVHKAEMHDQMHRLLLLKATSTALLLLAAGIAATAGRNFYKRAHMIRTGVGSDSPDWASRWLPRIMTGVMSGVMMVVLAAALFRLFKRDRLGGGV